MCAIKLVGCLVKQDIIGTHKNYVDLTIICVDYAIVFWWWLTWGYTIDLKQSS